MTAQEIQKLVIGLDLGSITAKIVFLDQNKQILKDLINLVGSEKYEAENPLIISGLGIAPADNCYGFKFIETSNTEMLNDSRLASSMVLNSVP